MHTHTYTDLLPNTCSYKSAMRGQLSPAYRPFCTNTTRSASHHVAIVNRDNVIITTIIMMMQMKQRVSAGEYNKWSTKVYFLECISIYIYRKIHASGLTEMTETESGNGKWKRKNRRRTRKALWKLLHMLTSAFTHTATSVNHSFSDPGHSFSLVIHGLTGTMSCNQDPIIISSQSIQDKTTCMDLGVCN